MARRAEERELGARRHELLGGLEGDVLEIGAGTFAAATLAGRRFAMLPSGSSATTRAARS
jgi:hypothetical protein